MVLVWYDICFFIFYFSEVVFLFVGCVIMYDVLVFESGFGERYE